MNRQRISRYSLMTFLGVLFFASTTSAAAPAFDNGTIARKYNFKISGTGADGNAIEVVGWFEANGSGVVGNVFSGMAAIAITSVSGASGSTVGLSTTTQSFILVKDEANGLYSTRLKFGDGLVQLTVEGSVLMADARGRSGNASGTYTWLSSALSGQGVARGEITAP